MDRAFLSGASPFPPGPPTTPSIGYPTGGDIATNTPATAPGPHWYHMVTMELVNLIAAAGITPDLNSSSQVRDAVMRLVDAPGTVKMFAGLNPSPGWLECDGRAVSRTTYAALFAAIGVWYGPGDDSTTFNLPNIQGRVVRGFSRSSSLDAGRLFGSQQADALQNITATFGGATGGSFPATGAVRTDGQQIIHLNAGVNGTEATWTFDASRVARTADETRMANVAMLYIIKT